MRSLAFVCVVILSCCGAAPPASSTAPTPRSFFALGGDVYRASEVAQAETGLLRFDATPRWFAGFPDEVTPEVYDAWARKQGQFHRQETQEGERVLQIPSAPDYPTSLDALPKTDQGATLKLATVVDAPANERELILSLTLASGERAIRREVEHRRTNVLPFLFAIEADGKPVSRAANGGVSEGGSNRFIELVPAESQKTWTLRVAVDSLATFAPAGTKELSIVAVFSERQHERYSPVDPLPLDEVWSSEALQEMKPQIVVRSNDLRLRKEGNRWR